MRRVAAWSLSCALIAWTVSAADPPAGVPADAEQVIVVRKTKGKVFQVEVTARERHGDGWAEVGTARAGVVGPKGFAPPGDKREGDGRTPSGVYRIGTAFGYGPTLDTKLDYHPATADDFWVDDADSPRYNRWVHGKPEAKSFEKLRRDDDAYKYAAVIEYNTDPVVPGAGSAIFLHVWAGPDRPTAGCVALAGADVTALLKWLDRRKKPVIVLDPH